MKKWVVFVIVIVVCVGAVAGTGCGMSNRLNATPSEGETVSLLEGEIYSLAGGYTIGCVENFYTKEDVYAPSDVVISWDAVRKAESYVVWIGQEEDLSDGEGYETVTPSVSLENLYMGEHYYYQIETVYADKSVTSDTFDFVTEALPRTIYVEGVSNTRDIGGYTTEDGSYRVRQGMIYRGAALDDISEEGRKSFLHTYGIKTDLDLRGTLGASPMGGNVNFVNVSAPYYALKHSEVAIYSKSYQEALVTAIRTFAKEENYPIYMHCQIGRDRTGTLAFLINGLLGVGEQDLYLDYELSFMSESGCRDLTDTVVPSNIIFNNYASLFKYMSRYEDATTLAGQIECFMLELGITQEEIASIKSIMLEKIPE